MTPPLTPKFVSFDVFGTLISVREGSYSAFRAILAASGGDHIDVRAFWEHWEDRNIAHYWEPYRPYRDISRLSLEETFAHYGLAGDGALIEHYFDAFAGFQLYPDVEGTLAALAKHACIAIVSNIDDDLLAQVRLPDCVSLRCTA